VLARKPLAAAGMSVHAVALYSKKLRPFKRQNASGTMLFGDDSELLGPHEAIVPSGRSTISFNDLATLVARRLGTSGTRRHIPVLQPE